jgi:hypothetical protein
VEPGEGAAFEGAASARRRGPAALVLAGLAVVAFAFVTRPPDSPPQDPDPSRPPPSTAAAEPSSPPSPAPTIAPFPSALAGPPPRDPLATPYPPVVSTPIEAGPVTIRPAGSTDIGLPITVPDGWERVDDAMVVKSGGVSPGGMSFGAWVVQDVFVYPCRWSSRTFVDRSTLRTAEGQAQALASWWGQDPGAPPPSNVSIAPVATRPQPATVRGLDAFEVGILVLSGFDFAACDADQLVFWETADGAVRLGLGPGELHRLWVVDVGGTIVVVDAATFPDTSPEDRVELQAIIDSITP